MMTQTITKISDTELEVKNTEEHTDIIDKASLLRRKAEIEALLREFE